MAPTPAPTANDVAAEPPRTMPSDALDDIELRHVQLSVANARTLSEDGSAGNKETVETRHGPITVAITGDTSKPVILTYHDLGLNHVTNFQAFFLYPEMRNIVNNFCIVHVNAPGQEEGAPTLPEGYVYPTMEELSETITCVKSHFHIRTFIGFGVGLGANVLARYATKYPADVDALVLINCSSTQAGWIEWGYQKLNIRHLRSGTMTTGVRSTIAGYAVPDVILVCPGLPKTRSGKIMRRILRKVAAGQPEEMGDTSTLADPSVVEAIVSAHAASATP